MAKLQLLAYGEFCDCYDYPERLVVAGHPLPAEK